MRLIYSVTMMGLLVVIVVGAYTRIKDAGLGCPDWPGCYGYVIPPEQSQVNTHQFDTRSFDQGKAWIEMWHRYIAGTLGLVVIGLAFNQIIRKKNLLISGSLIALVLMQANLGRLTVTMKLQPIIVSLHLIGGLSLLFLTQLLSNRQESVKGPYSISKIWIFKVIVATYLVQILLGAWVSTNYAGLVCQGFPGCHSQSFLPKTVSLQVFNFTDLWASSQPLSFFTAGEKEFIHMLHRLNALFLGVSIGFLGFYHWSGFTVRQRVSYLSLLFVYSLQLFVGIALVYLRLPVSLATAHNLLAALMGTVLISFYFCSRVDLARQNGPMTQTKVSS